MEDNQPKYFNDEGTEVNSDLVAKPSLCITCKKDEIANEEILCNLNRMDQQGDEDFQCGAYEPKK